MLTERLIRRILEGPPRSTQPMVSDAWPAIELVGPHGPFNVHVNRREGPAPTVVAIHGWTSGVAHARNRTEGLATAGFNVVLLEMLAHGSSTYEGEFTAQAVIECLEHLLDQLSTGSLGMEPTEEVILHGHSLGGYVAIGALRGRHNSSIKAFLLESPMTCYSPILMERLRWLPVFSTFIVRRLQKRWNTMHPSISISSLRDVDVPNWGRPEVPVFVMQADPDHRLGTVHLDALLNAVSPDLIDVWKSTSLRHSGTSRHSERDAALLAWLEAKGFIPRC